MSKPTPGPWKVLGTTTVIKDCGDIHEETICEVEDTNAFVQNESLNAANARLIAAAPDMLEALKLAMKWLGNCVPVVTIEGPKPMPVIAAAIAKAEPLPVRQSIDEE